MTVVEAVDSGDEDRERLLVAYERLEDEIEEGSLRPLWALGDWLVEHVPAAQGARRDFGGTPPKLTLTEVAACRGRSERWLRQTRKVALTTADNRLPEVSLSAYERMLKIHGWDLQIVNAAFRLTEAEKMEERSRRRAEQRRQDAAATLGDDTEEVLSQLPSETLLRLRDALQSPEFQPDSEDKSGPDVREKLRSYAESTGLTVAAALHELEQRMWDGTLDEVGWSLDEVDDALSRTDMMPEADPGETEPEHSVTDEELGEQFANRNTSGPLTQFVLMYEEEVAQEVQAMLRELQRAWALEAGGVPAVVAEALRRAVANLGND